MEQLKASAILERLSKALGVTTDIELAQKLEVATQTISTWKKRNKVPLDHIVDISAKNAFSLDSIVFGNDLTDPNTDVHISYKLAQAAKGMSDLYLAEAVLERLDEELHLVDKGLTAETLTTIISVMGDVKKRVPGGVYFPSKHEEALSEGIKDYLSYYHEIMHIARINTEKKSK